MHRFVFEKAGQWAGCAGRAQLPAKANFVGSASGFDCGFESKSHARWVIGDGDGGIHEHGVGAHFHRLSGVAWRADAGVDHDWDGGLFDDDANLIASLDAPILSLIHI